MSITSSILIHRSGRGQWCRVLLLVWTSMEQRLGLGHSILEEGRIDLLMHDIGSWYVLLQTMCKRQTLQHAFDIVMSLWDAITQ